MGLVLLAGLLAFVVAGLTALVGAGISVRRCGDIRVYWMVGILSFVSMPLLLRLPVPPPARGEYSMVTNLLTAGFSKSNAVVIVGTCIAAAFSYIDSVYLRIVSALTWGFVSVFVVYVFRVL